MLPLVTTPALGDRPGSANARALATMRETSSEMKPSPFIAASQQRRRREPSAWNVAVMYGADASHVRDHSLWLRRSAAAWYGGDR